MAQQLNTANYSTINNNMNALLTSGAYSGITISIFTDANCTNVASDEAGPILTRKISQIGYTAAHALANGQTQNGSLTLQFNDGTSLVAIDGVDNYWYQLQGVIFQPRRFNTI